MGEIHWKNIIMYNKIKKKQNWNYTILHLQQKYESIKIQIL